MSDFEKRSIAQGKLILEARASEKKRGIPYRPEYNLLTGSPEASILLQQIYYWWRKKDHKPFYKFSKPCAHRLYQPGDSWTEELGFSLSKFYKARKSLAIKITTGTSKKEISKLSPIIFWTDSDRVTWYQVNEDLISRLIYCAYNGKDILEKIEIQNYLGKPQYLILLSKCEEQIFLSTENTSKNVRNQDFQLQNKEALNPLLLNSESDNKEGFIKLVHPPSDMHVVFDRDFISADDYWEIVSLYQVFTQNQKLEHYFQVEEEAQAMKQNERDLCELLGITIIDGDSRDIISTTIYSSLTEHTMKLG